MAYEHKEGQGSLFKNEKQNDRQPDYKGTIVIGGTTYEIAAWEKTSKSGMSYMSLQAALPREHPSQLRQEDEELDKIKEAARLYAENIKKHYSEVEEENIFYGDETVEDELLPEFEEEDEGNDEIAREITETFDSLYLTSDGNYSKTSPYSDMEE